MYLPGQMVRESISSTCEVLSMDSLEAVLALRATSCTVAFISCMPHVAAEIANTLVGSFGLVTAAPLTALAGSLLLGGGK